MPIHGDYVRRAIPRDLHREFSSSVAVAVAVSVTNVVVECRRRILPPRAVSIESHPTTIFGKVNRPYNEEILVVVVIVIIDAIVDVIDDGGTARANATSTDDVDVPRHAGSRRMRPRADDADSDTVVMVVLLVLLLLLLLLVIVVADPAIVVNDIVVVVDKSRDERSSEYAISGEWREVEFQRQKEDATTTTTTTMPLAATKTVGTTAVA